MEGCDSDDTRLEVRCSCGETEGEEDEEDEEGGGGEDGEDEGDEGEGC